LRIPATPQGEHVKSRLLGQQSEKGNDGGLDFGFDKQSNRSNRSGAGAHRALMASLSGTGA